ncbi:MAG: hypothetical protein GY929_07885 [Actinomycetia bacterium]|nr:hypothetical protein [Actinomycetes bacterium]
MDRADPTVASAAPGGTPAAAVAPADGRAPVANTVSFAAAAPVADQALVADQAPMIAPAPAPDGGPEPEELDPGWEGPDPATLDQLPRWIRDLIAFVVVGACSAFTLLQLQPSLLLADTTPAGGDMGAHVWALGYLRDVLLPDLRLSGWSPDWYGGFPAFHFYMVVPFLAMIVLNAGLPIVLGIPVAVGALGLGLGIWFGPVPEHIGRHRALALGAGLAVALLAVPVPFGVAFKLVSVSGLVSLPIAAWGFGRLVRLPFPGPPMLALATMPFLFDRSFTIYGGNIASTLAGEFAFSISLSLAMVYLGVVARGLETGRHRGAAAALLALTGLCHLFPAFFAVVGTLVLFVLGPRRERLRWLVPVAVVAGLLSAFWVVPFVATRAYLNDMGWEKITDYTENLVPDSTLWVLLLALVSAGVVLVRRNRIGMFFAVLALAGAASFVLVPQGRLWNARLLPFYYLSLNLLAAVGVTEIIRWLADEELRLDRVGRLLARVGGLAVATLLVFVHIGLPFRILPGGTTLDDGRYSWMGITTSDSSFIDDWASWNYSGYERKPAYPEYRQLVTTMEAIGDQNGCGRAMWEYEPELDRFGTPMALMLLPHWTDGCIGSMEGLYFEASATTPYHFLNQSELSAAPSRAQRDLPYRELDLDRGVEHLQLMGVRYYLTISDAATAVADTHPDLTLLGTSGAWSIYEVDDAPLVEALTALPVVVDGLDHTGESWLPISVDFYQDRDAWSVFLAADGPDDWARIAPGEIPPARPTTPVTISDIETGTKSLSFSVDEVGTPVLVKASYFPNWTASGADGPWRVTPNLMVVVPTDNEVTLNYGRTLVDYGSWALTAIGILGFLVLSRLRSVVLPAAAPPIGTGWPSPSPVGLVSRAPAPPSPIPASPAPSQPPDHGAPEGSEPPGSP